MTTENNPETDEKPVDGTPVPSAKDDDTGLSYDEPGDKAVEEASDDAAKDDADEAAKASEAEEGKDDEAKDDEKPSEDEASDVELYEVKVPEGIEIDKELLAGISPILREADVSPEHAQKLTDVYAKIRAEEVKKSAAKWKETTDGWEEAAKADSDIGGDKWDDTVANAEIALKEVATKELVELLETTGMGNHPEMIRMSNKFGAILKENQALKAQLAKEDEPYKATDNPPKKVAQAPEVSFYGKTTPAERKI